MDFKKRYLEEKIIQLNLWKGMISTIFGEELNDSIKITDPNRIIEILNTIGKDKALNHMFMPSGGGLDLTGAVGSNEKGLVELHFGETAIIVNPESLTFHPVGDNPEWWYFRLNTLPFAASGVYEETQPEYSRDDIFFIEGIQVKYKMDYYGEEVLEIKPGKYIDRYFWNLGYLGFDANGDKIPFPENTRIVSRKYNGGDFVIFPKLSQYNRNTSTYDARHNGVSDEFFQRYITYIVEERARRIK